MSKPTRSYRYRSPWAKELNDIVRGASGGFLFGIPLLYTMEVWGIGSYVEPPLMLGILLITYMVVLLLNRVEGFRRRKRTTILGAALESLEALAIGMTCSTLILILLQRITLSTPLDEALGKIIFEGVPYAIGASLARLLLSDGSAESTPESWRILPRSTKLSKKDRMSINDTLADVSATLIGAIIVAFSIAPTDEVVLLAAAASAPWLLAIIGASLVISYGIVFAAGFANQEKRQQQRGLFQSPQSETIISYLISLLASAVMLGFFQQLSFADPWNVWLSYTIVLGLPATVGGAAGRLAI